MPEHSPQNQDEQPGLALLWVQSQPAVSAFIRSSVRDGHAADDLLQQVAVITTREFESYDHSRPFTNWAIGIAKMQVLSYFRDQGRDRLHFDDDLLGVIADAHAEMKVKSGPRLDALESCLERVHAKSRQLIEMRYLRNLSLQQISNQSELTVNAVRSALHRIRNALARCITDKLGQGGDM